jgi:hypothetical protein
MREMHVRRGLGAKAAGTLMAIASVTLIGASFLHFGLTVPVGSAMLRDPFPGAAIPELVLGLIEGAGAIAVLARGARTAGIVTTAFAIVVVLFGLSITIGSGRAGDIVYHLLLLLTLLLAGFQLLAGRRVARSL